MIKRLLFSVLRASNPSCSALYPQILAKHVMSLHVSALTQTQAVEGEIELNKLKKLIAYCRA